MDLAKRFLPRPAPVEAGKGKAGKLGIPSSDFIMACPGSIPAIPLPAALSPVPIELPVDSPLGVPPRLIFCIKEASGNPGKSLLQSRLFSSSSTSSSSSVWFSPGKSSFARSP